MALRKCRECGKKISTKAKACPNCGSPNSRPVGLFKLIFALIFLFILYVFFWSPSDDDNKKSSMKSTKKPQTQITTTAKAEKTSKQDYSDIRVILPEKLMNIDINGRYFKGIESRYIRTGPSMNSTDDDSGPLSETDQLYVIQDANDWIQFRVTPEDQGWSAWIDKSFTKSIREIHAERVARFGEKPKSSSWDGSVRCVKKYLESVAREPESLKYDKWSDVSYSEDGWIVYCEYRGRNGFGGYDKSANWFVIQHGKVADTKEHSAYGI